MPLTKSSSPEAFKSNVRNLMGDVGKSPHVQSRKQALAIAYDVKRRAGRADGGVVGDRFDALPNSSNVEDRRPGSEYDQRQQAADARQIATFRTAMSVKGRFRPPARASGGRVAVKGMLEDAADKLETGLVTVGKAGGGGIDASDLPYRGGEITPWYVRQEASAMGRKPSLGAIKSVVPGRTDALPMSVKRGSYVVPADVVSGMPGAQGNSAAGHKILENMFKTGPYGMKLPGGRGGRGSGFPRAPALPRAEGGLVGPPDQQQDDDLVDIDAAGGEHILGPEVAAHLGDGNPELGFKILDNFVRKVREMHIKTLKKLPGPKTA